MGIFRRPDSTSIDKLIRNPHFWAIAIITMGLIALYYGDLRLSPDNQWPWFEPIKLFEFKYRIHGILFYIPIVYSAFIFWWRGAVITWIICMIVASLRIFYFIATPAFILSNIFYLLIPLLIIIIISLEFKWRERDRKVFTEREAERQSYLSQIFRAQENERQRLAQELHDDATQTLLAIVARAQILGSDDEVKALPKVREQVQWIKDTTTSVSGELRRLSTDLRPGVLDNLGLIPALRWLVTGLSQDGIKTRLEVVGIERKLSPEVDINLFRIIQEGLNNIRRHSRATEALVNLEFASKTVKVTIEDNGIGFSPPKEHSQFTPAGKLGLNGMQQRVQFINGTLTFDSELGKGTTIRIEIKT